MSPGPACFLRYPYAAPGTHSCPMVCPDSRLRFVRSRGWVRDGGWGRWVGSRLPCLPNQNGSTSRVTVIDVATASPDTLFDDFERTDDSPAPFSESRMRPNVRAEALPQTWYHYTN